MSPEIPRISCDTKPPDGAKCPQAIGAGEGSMVAAATLRNPDPLFKRKR